MSAVPVKARAFSLVEIVLALGLVSFSMLAIFALVAQGQKTSREARLESVAALLAGRATSQLRASAAWSSTNADYTGSSTLFDIAALPPGQSVTLTNYYDLNLSNVTTSNPGNRQFAMVTEVGPVSSAKLSSGNPEVADAISRLGSAGNTVYLNIEVSYPALAPAANRSKRSFSSIITRTSAN